MPKTRAGEPRTAPPSPLTAALNKGRRQCFRAGIRPNRQTSLDERTAAAYSCGVERRSDVVPDPDDQVDGACELRRLRGEVLGGEAGRAAARLRSGRGGEPARRSCACGRRRRVQARRRAGDHLHARLLPAGRRRPRRLRSDRCDERAQRRLRDGRHAAARALDRRVPRGASDRDARRDLRRGRRAGARGRRTARGRAHDPRRRAEVRARGRRHGAPRRNLAEERRATGRLALPDEAARNRPDHDRLQEAGDRARCRSSARCTGCGR